MAKKLIFHLFIYFIQDLESLKKTFDETETQIGLQNSYLNMTQNVLPGKNFDYQKYHTCSSTGLLQSYTNKNLLIYLSRQYENHFIFPSNRSRFLLQCCSIFGRFL